jgi:hypothetical protein
MKLSGQNLLSLNLFSAPRAGGARSRRSSRARQHLSYLLILALLVTALVRLPQTSDALIIPTPSTETIIGLTTGNQLVTFNSNAPDWILSTVQITGLLGGEIVLGIDFRPANNQLYGYTNYNRLVTLNQGSGAATVVAALSVNLNGNEYGVDFNPTNDRLRLVNDNDQNASVNPADGVVTLQTPLNPGNPNVVGVAYTNSFAGATTTTLYDIDSNTDTLYTQNPPASGTLAPVGPLGVDTNSLVGFDISGQTGVAYASLSSAFNVSSLYSINLASGQAQFLGPIGSGPVALRDMTISPVPPQTIFGVTTANRLISFNSAKPGVVLSDAAINGLLNGEIVLGIDFRPLNNQLFGFTNYNRLVTLNPATATATVVGTPNPLSGNEYGFDFNPVPDRVRIVNDNDQNARLNPDTGATAATDPNLAYAPGDPNFGQNPNVVGAAYTNSVAGATATTLYDIDSNLDVLVTQGGLNSNPSPNNGQLFTVGPLGVNTNGLVGFDISGQTGIAYASLSTPFNVSSLYAINLSTGAASLVGQIGANANSVRGIAISTLPPPLVFGVTSSNKLVTFSSLNPTTLLSSKPITGLINGENVLGIDFRPANGTLYGYTGYNRVITIDTTTGAATALGTPANLVGNSYGFDFNPVPDRIRVVNDNEQNIRVNPNDGTLAATDGPLAYQAMDPLFGTDPNVVGAAYTNSVAGATATTLYYLDSRFNSLATSPSPNSGFMQTVAFFDFDFSQVAGFDIAPANNAAYAALQPEGGGLSSRLYAIDLTAGLPNRPNRGVIIGTIGGGEAIVGIALAPAGAFQFTSATLGATEGVIANLPVTITRSGDANSAASVNYATQDGTATAGSDYTATSGTLFFNPGETSKTIFVPIIDNATAEPSETFTVVLSSPTGGFISGTVNTVTITITDND